MKYRLFTSESVTEGHPDKVCDSISDAVLDAVLAQDSAAHCACETCATTDMVMVLGEIRANAQVDVESIVRKTVADIGYDRKGLGFDSHTLTVFNRLHAQSADIAQGVDSPGSQHAHEDAAQGNWDAVVQLHFAQIKQNTGGHRTKDAQDTPDFSQNRQLFADMLYHACSSFETYDFLLLTKL